MLKNETHPVIYGVVVNWNRPQDTIECISSLTNQVGVHINIVLVDNGSDDDSVEIVQKAFHDVKIITNASNLGFAIGYNIGIKYALDARADYILIINNDAFIGPNTIINLLEYGQDENVGIVAPIIYFTMDPEIIWSAGGNIRPLLLEYTNKEKGRKKEDNWPEILKRDFVTGCCFLAARKTFEDIGLFDEHFVLYYEDADYCYRVRKSNLQILVVTKANAWHKVALSSGGRDSPKERYWMGRSSILYFSKHASIWKWFFIIPYRIGSASRTMIRLAINKQFASAYYHIKGIIDGLKYLIRNNN